MFFSGCSTNYCATLRLQIEKITLSYNLMFHLPEFISQQITISRAIFHFRNYAVKNKKPDTHLDNHCIKIGVRLWSEWGDLNSRPLGPEPSALPTALHPEIIFAIIISEVGIVKNYLRIYLPRIVRF